MKTVVPLSSIVIDDYCGVYRTRCGNPKCGAIVEQDLDDRIIAQLEGLGVPRVNDLVERARIQLANDDMLWRMIESGAT